MLFNAPATCCFAFAGSYWVLFLSRVISGFAGGTSRRRQAYIADITTPAERSRGMGIVGAAFGIGFSLGPAVGGLADHFLGHHAPGLIAVGLSLANFVSAYFILPESLRPELRVKRPLFDLRHIGDAIARPRPAPPHDRVGAGAARLRGLQPPHCPTSRSTYSAGNSSS